MTTRSYSHHHQMTVSVSHYHKDSQKCKGCKISCLFDLGLCSMTALHGAHSIMIHHPVFPTNDDKKLPPPSSDDSFSFPLPSGRSKLYFLHFLLAICKYGHLGQPIYLPFHNGLEPTPSWSINQCFQQMTTRSYHHQHQMSFGFPLPSGLSKLYLALFISYLQVWPPWAANLLALP